MYDKEFRISVCKEYLNSGITRKSISDKYSIPFETFKSWLKSYYSSMKKENKNSNVKICNKMVKKSDYDNMSLDQLKIELIKKDIEIERLKKKYTVNITPTGEKEYVIFKD